MGGWAFILEDVLARERQAYDDLQLAYDKTAAALGKEVSERDNANQERDWAREHNNAMRMAGCDLATAALRVMRDYDGVHRLFLAVSALAKVLADEGGRGGVPDEALDEGE